MQDHPFNGINLREQPEAYRIGRGEYGVWHAEPYKSQLLPHWQFKDEAAAESAVKAIWSLYEGYRSDGDFPGMDVARKFLQMGFTRARRYAKYPDGQKYDEAGNVKPVSGEDPEKAAAAQVFKAAWDAVREDEAYQEAKEAWREAYEQ
ncbi:MAG: DUF4385 family protein [Bacteroidetes bacterium]|jgi:hypothetical protein|nr:DUF4385 family protein [Bacteroidota bacterium]